MKKAIKTVLTVILYLMITGCIVTAAFAAGDNTIRVNVSGTTLDVSPVLLQDGRTYAPYEKLFAVLGATVEYDETDGVITAVKGDTEIVIERDGYYIWVTDGGVTQTIYTHAPTITDTQSDAIYVPIRYVSQALGYVVSWDGATKSVVLKTVDDLIDESGATYTVMDAYLTYLDEFNEKCHQVDGEFQADINLNTMMDYDAEDMTSGSLTFSGTASGLIDPGGEDMDLNLKTNLSEFLLNTPYEDELDEDMLAIIAQLDDVDISLIINNEDGMIYIQSPLLSMLADISEDTWISIETGEVLPLTDLDTVSGVSGTSVLTAGATSGADGFRQLVAMLLKSTIVQDAGNETADLLAQLNSIFSDQAMTRDGDDYVITMAGDDESYYSSNSHVFELRFAFDDEVFTGITVEFSSTIRNGYTDEYNSESTLVFSYSFLSDGHSDLSLTMGEDGITLLSFDLSCMFTETTEQPARAPSENSTVVPIEELETEGPAVEIE